MQDKSQNNMANIAKTQTQKTTKSKKQPVISRENRKKIARAYYQLYRVFLLKNLLAGMTLGAASHNAMQLVRAKIATMDKANPVTKYLLRINARHSKRVAKRIMTNKYRDARATATPETRAKIAKLMPKWLAFSLNTFNTMSALYKPKTIAKPAPTKTVAKPAPQVQRPTLLQIKIAEQQRQRAA
ncbi:MAG: hypothetical protein IJ866_01405 [Alphaproteobacteria bacterium]|nr:hypothetical protein [Alphaproteobacteria bacterium]